MSGLSFRKVTPDDDSLLLDWRRRPHVAANMLSEVDNDIKKQRAWLIRTNTREDYTHRILQLDGRDIGYCSITVTDPKNGIGEIGIYIGESDVPRELTIANYIYMLNHAFYTLKLHKLVNHVIGSNSRVLAMQKFNGYRHVGVLKEQVLLRGERQDLHIFEQLASDWALFSARKGIRVDMDGNLVR
jgi:RimJ/RimL family protein N-acetyltransferase